jgi:hypothetical protein
MYSTVVYILAEFEIIFFIPLISFSDFAQSASFHSIDISFIFLKKFLVPYGNV